MLTWLIVVYALLASFVTGCMGVNEKTTLERPAMLAASVAFVVVALVAGVCNRLGVL